MEEGWRLAPPLANLPDGNLLLEATMTQIAIRTSSEVPVSLELGSRLHLDDDALFELCRANRELRIERTAAGDLEIMTPIGGEGSARKAQLMAELMVWTHRDGRGVAFDCSVGYLLPSGAMRSPDASWVRRERLDRLPAEARRRFLPLVPDFVAELRSETDRLPPLEAKMEEWMAAGVRLGWLIDPLERRVTVYRPGEPPERLEAPAEVSAELELAGFVLGLGAIWEPF